MKSIESADGTTAKQPKNSLHMFSKRKNTAFNDSIEIDINRDQFRFLSKTMPIALALYKVNLDSKNTPIELVPLEVNPEFKTAFGITAESMLNRTLAKFIEQITSKPVDWLSIYGRISVTGVAENFVIYSPIDQKYFHVYIFSPNQGYCISAFRDITKICIERQKIIEQLKDSAEKYQYIIKYAPTGIYEIDIHTKKFRNVNDIICRMLGYTEKELLSMNPLDFLYPESRKRFQQRVACLLSGQKIDDSVEYHVKTGNGTSLWSLMHVKFLYKNGEVDAALVVAYDITERKRSERELLSAEKRYRRLYETTQDGIMARDLEGKMIDCNPAYAKMLGYTRKELRKFSVRQLLPEKWHEQRDRVVQKVLQTGHSIVFEREYKRKDGSVFPASVRSWRLTDGRGKVIGIWSIVRDISQQKRLQKNLEQHAGILEKIVQDREKQLKETERLVAIGQTAGMVGHDLRNPLQTLTGELYLAKIEVDSLEEGEAKSNLEESIRVIEEQVIYMDKIVSDLQAFVRPVKIDKKPLSLHELVKTVLETVTIPNNISVHIDNPGESFQIRADPQLLKRVMINLVTNAVQAMPNGGNLFVDTHITAAGFVSISVKDTGVGIPDKIRSQIFTPLFTTKPRGQGFGLAVCKRVIEAHGGTITFESAEGKGTSFVIAFPSS